MHKVCRIIVAILVVTRIIANDRAGIPNNSGECRCTQYYPAANTYCSCFSYFDFILFKIRYTPKSVSISCTNLQNWSNYSFNINSTIEKTVDFIFYFCKFENDNKIIDVIRSTGVKEIKRLTINQYILNERLHLTRDNFVGLSTISMLNIDSNSQSSHLFFQIDEDFLLHLPKLSIFKYSRSTIISIPKNFFQYTPLLNNISINNCMIRTIVSGTFNNLRNLNSLDISRNNLIELKDDIFDHLDSLIILSLKNNKLTKLPKGIFKQCKALQKINISKNKFKTLPSGLFRNLINLKFLYLHNCKFKSLPNDLFRGLKNLYIVNLKFNRLRTLLMNSLSDQENLGYLSISYNTIEYLPVTLFRSCRELLMIQVNNNRLSNISSLQFSGCSNLKVLVLSNNNIKSIEKNTFQQLSELTILDLSHNKLMDLQDIMQYLPVKFLTYRKFNSTITLNLSFNQITSIPRDWTLHVPFKHERQNFINWKSWRISKIKIVLSNNNITSIGLSSELDTIHQVFPYILELYIENNPIACDCFLYDFVRYIDKTMNSTVYRNLNIHVENTECYSPKELKGVHLSALKSKNYTCQPSSIDELKNITYCPKSSMLWKRIFDKTLILDYSKQNLTQAPEELCSLVNDEYLIELNLTGNNLKNFPDLNRNGYQKVKTLLLSDNEITTIENISVSPNLRYLELHNNQIKTLSSQTLHTINSTLQNITLAGNPWKCNCDNDKLSFLMRNFIQFIVDVDNVKCADTKEIIYTLKRNEMCKNEYQKLVIIGSFIFVVLSLIIFILKDSFILWRKNIRVWLYAYGMCLRFVTEEELDQDRTYDAFISFSQKDECFVMNELVKHLEEGPYKICIPSRDGKIGGHIPEQIMNLIKESKRTIFVVSRNFLESPWALFEFQTALTQKITERKSRIIVILYGDIGPMENIDNELRIYLNMYTYLKWDDSYFWQKLHYALPHKTKQRHNNL